MAENKFPVLSVKYKIPSPRNHYIIRAGLMERLKHMQENPVTIIKAGAGSGKTTLLSVFIKEIQLEHVHWIAMDAGLNQVFLFWKYVYGALEEEISGERDSLHHCFESNIQKEMLEQILAAFAGQLYRPEAVYLVLDDFQWIENTYLLETLNQFIRMMPENMHLIICSRKMPEINLGTLYMAGNLLLVNEEDMRLSKDECREFLIYTLGMSSDTKQLDDIIINANGWIGGAQLMAISGREGKPVPAALSSAGESVIYDYIEREIFLPLSEVEKQFLLKTAVLSYFNEDICSAYLPDYDFASIIKSISGRNLFVILIDETKQEYRYHAILREFLVHLLNVEPYKSRDLYIKAADILYEMQDYEECVRLLFESRSYEILMQRLLQMPQNTATFSYMMQVPKEQIVKNPNFAYQYFFCYYASVEIEECGKIYSYIKTHLDGDETFQAFEHSDLFFNVHWEFRKVAVLSFSQIEALPLNQVSKAYLLIKEAYFLFLSDRVSDAMAYLDQAEKIYKRTENIYIEHFILAEKTQILEEYGEFTMALEMYAKMKALIKELPAMETSYYIGIAGVHIRQLRLLEAEKELELAKESMNKTATSIVSAYLYTLAEWYYVIGNPEKTEEIITELVKDEVYQSVFFSSRLLRYPVYRGKNVHLSKRFLDNYKKLEDTAKNMDTELLYTGIEYEIGDKEEALKLVNQLVGRARKAGNKVKIIEGTLMKARFLYEQKGWDRSILNLLMEAVEYAHSECIRLPFWFEKTFVLKLLKERKTEIKNILSIPQIDFLNGILYGNIKETEKNDFPYGLTDREMEVLRQMALGKTNKEIGEKLCISLATVKTHIINIYGKLGVNNRLSAVNKIKIRIVQ